MNTAERILEDLEILVSSAKEAYADSENEHNYSFLKALQLALDRAQSIFDSYGN